MLFPRFIRFFWLCLCCQQSISQNPIFQDQGLNKDPSTYKFSLTSNSDCSDNLKNIYDFEATVIGYEINSLDTGPTDCTIHLTSQDHYPNVQLLVKIISANIDDCETTLGIYDGQDGNLLESFDCAKNTVHRDRYLPTSGDTVTFRFKRPNPSSYNFDIDIRVSRQRGGPNPDWGEGYGQGYYFDKFPQETIVGLIGGFYGLILLICLGVILYFNFKYQGRLKRWETHQLSTMRTGTSFGSRGQVNEPSRIWTMEMPEKGPSDYYSRSQTETYSRKHRGTSDDGSGVVYDHDDPFQRNLMSTKKDQSRDRVASENTNFADSDQDDPDHFEEREIKPRWRPRDRRKGRQNDHRPPSFEEAVSERSSRHSSDESEEDETESSEDSIPKKRITSDEESSRSSSRSPSETESESDDESLRGARARRLKEKRRKDKRHRRSSTDGETSSYRSGPRRKRPPAEQAAAAAPYAAYPPGQFVPVMAGPPAFQPVHMVPNYPPPQYPDEPQAAHRQPQVHPTDPPVYSYLVRRGYTPMEPNVGRNSPAGSGSQKGPQEEPEAPLQSGVEYMRR